MKRNQNDQGDGICSINRTNKGHDDINILEPGPESDLFIMGDEDEDLLDYSLMGSVKDLDYEESITL